MKTKLFLVVATSLTLLACTSTPKVQVQYEDISIPELGTESVATMGEKMLMQAKGYYTNSITVEAFDLHFADLHQTTTFYRAADGGDAFYSDEGKFLVLNNGFGAPINQTRRITYEQGADEFCYGPMTCLSNSDVTFTYNDKKDIKIKPNTFQQVIEYNGRAGDVLKFTYREFTDNMARSSYTTDFNIDLSEGNQLGYKGAVIEIVDANNSLIKYKVLKNFNR
ncbi:hypothetical protein [Pseudidiomarina donghaiensis]|uniref:hypothetical protein n=1 Tax=Pseudidiomarina donghaiensis TaxID=519452 RepID=UPI003A97198F